MFKKPTQGKRKSILHKVFKHGHKRRDQSAQPSERGINLPKPARTEPTTTSDTIPPTNNEDTTKSNPTTVPNTPSPQADITSSTVHSPKTIRPSAYTHAQPLRNRNPMWGADLCDTGNTSHVSDCDSISISIDMDIGGGGGGWSD
jgi:hypothetical protein